MDDGAFVVNRYFDNPSLYVKEILKAEPDEWQSKVLDSVVSNKRIAVASGHGIGKTALTSWVIHWFISTRPNPQIVCTANTKNQLDTKTWRELAKWNSRALNGDWFQHTATRFTMKDAPDTWFASAIPWTEHNSEAFAGTHEKHVLVLFDEASAIADVIWDVIEGAMTTPGARWLAFGNPTKNTGRFRECFGRFRHRWMTMQVDSRTAKMADKDQIEQWRQDFGEDSDFFRVRVKGEFPSQGSNQFISSADVDEACRRSISADSGDPVIIGVDVARFGDDQTVIAVRKGRELIDLRKFRGLDTMQVVGHVIRAKDEFNPDMINIDEGAMGAGVVDRLREQGFNIRGVNFGEKPFDTQWQNKRVEMWGEMREWVKTGRIPNDDELKSDLIGPEYYINSKNQIALERKEDMKKRGLSSPDCGDALALTFAFRVSRRKSKGLQQNISWMG